MIDFSKIYKEEILDKVSAVIVDYKNTNGKFCYEFKHHILDDCAKDKICDLLINNVAFYAYNIEELTANLSNYSNLRDMAKHTFGERLARRINYKSDGLVGELLLDILIQHMKIDANKLYTRARYTQIKDNQEIKGYDAAYFVREENNIELWLGQSKAGQEKYCIENIQKDLNKKYCDKYFSSVLRYVVDRATGEVKDPILLDLINEINSIIQQSISSGKIGEERKEIVEKAIIHLLVKMNVAVVAPCLVAFDTELYKDAAVFQENIEKIVNRYYSSFESKTFELNKTLEIKVIFIILPINELNEIKQMIINVKKEVQ